jgi:hypothetical protein
MRRNRTSALKPKTVVTSIVICAAVCLAGIGYVWAKSQVWTLSGDIKKLEVQLDDLRRDNDGLQRKYATMCSPSNLDARVRELNLGLSAPLPSQIIRLPAHHPIVQKKTEPQYFVSTNND